MTQTYSNYTHIYVLILTYALSEKSRLEELHYKLVQMDDNKGAGALRRLRGTNFEALVLVLKIWLGG